MKTIKSLGMIFDQKLTWESHIKNLIAACQKEIKMLKILANKSWGADTSTLLTIYRSLIRSKIDYGSIVYNSARTTLLKKLETVHNFAVRIALGAYCTTVPAQ